MKKIFTTGLFLLAVTSLSAETRYVTDRILLGIHIGADEATKVIKSVPSGTKLEVIDTEEGFIHVRLEDGTEGWVSEGFVMENVPATRKYDVLAHQYEKTTQELDKLKIDYAKKEREVQIRRDQVSNANTTIRDLRKRGGGKIVVDPELTNKLVEANMENETLKLKIVELEKKKVPVVDIDQKQIADELEDIKNENDFMKTRIDVALALLNGERIPTKEELATIRPKFPNWYWSLLAVILLIGVVAGYFIMDYRYRSRHGGFRI